MKIVAVTACVSAPSITGMAAAALKKAARAMGHEIKVETQVALQISGELQPSDIEAADAVIFAADTLVQKRERFCRKRVLEVVSESAIRQADMIIAGAFE